MEMERFEGDKLSHVMSTLAIIKNVTNDINLRLNGLKNLYKNISVTSQYLEHQLIAEVLENIVLESGNDNDNNWEYFQMKRYAFCCLEKVATRCSDEFFQNYYLYLKKHLNLSSFELRREENSQEKTSDNDVSYPLKSSNMLLNLLKRPTIVNTAYNWYKELPTETSASVSETHFVPEILEKLDRYVDMCDKTQKFRMLKTLSICICESAYGIINLSIFKEFQSRDWSKELLMYTLLSNNNAWSVNQTSKLVREINRLDIFLKECNHSRCIEDVLEILITTQETCELDIEFIIKVLTLLHSNDSLELIFKDFCFLPDVFSQLELFQFKQKCNDHEITYTDDNQIKELQYLLFYSDEIIDITLSKVKPGIPITELIEFFQLVKERAINRKEDFLLQLNPNGAIEDWKRELSLSVIRTLICQEFPAWEYETAGDITSDFDKIYFLSIIADSNKECTKYCDLNRAQRNELRDAVSLENSKLLLHKLLYDLNHSLIKLMSKCKFSKATLEEIKNLIYCLDSENKIIQLINVLRILIEYENAISQNDDIKILITPLILDVIKNSTEMNVQKNIHDFIIQRFFRGTYEKSVDQLIDELITTNKKENIKFLRDRQDLMIEYNKVMNAYNSKPTVFGKDDLIKNWDKEAIKKWSFLIRLPTMKKEDLYARCRSEIMKDIRAFTPSNFALSKTFDDALNRTINEISVHERIAVIKRAMELTAEIKIRDVQLLSLILLLNCQEDKGRLAQINTGEGKTITIAMIAAYHALKGHQVDVITSSRLLAIPQSSEFAEFYDTLCLVVSHNFGSNVAYRANVLYGTSNEFQGDILFDEFQKSGCRHGRKCDVAIVDEVDNMLVDSNNHIVMLSCEMPAMDHLETILATIYAQVKTAAGSIVVKDGQSFFIERESVFDENNEIKEVIEHHIPIEGTMQDFVINSTELHVRKLIRDCDTANLSSDCPEIKIPKHLRELCKTQLKKWIVRAIAAKFHRVIKEDYILEDNTIKIIDADNTGVIQHFTRWSDGLHQFLEIKHGTNVTPESLASNFISNVSFFRRYRPKLYGLSGTLGCQATKKLLAKTYDLDFVVVPPFKFKQHKELSPIIVNNRDDWNREIVKSSLSKLCNSRAVLIIMEYIDETEAIEKIFVDEFDYDKNKIKLYKTDNDSSVIDEPLESGHVIITTNIAGRGTDIKLTKDVEENGGLHVCITFLPKNSRVEEQNVGRTSRTGNRGTSQFILCNGENDIAKLRENRYKKEEKILRNAENEVERATTNDEIFQKFCQLLDLIKSRNTFVRKIERKAVEERFAIWLKIHDDQMTNEIEKLINNVRSGGLSGLIHLTAVSATIDKPIEVYNEDAELSYVIGDTSMKNPAKIQYHEPKSGENLGHYTLLNSKSDFFKSFELFREEILRDDRNGKLIKNPYLFVTIGNKYLNHKEYENAISEYTSAIKMDPDFAEHAHYNRGYAYIAKYGDNATKNKCFINKAIYDFKTARKLIQEREYSLHLMQYASEGEVFSKQISKKLNLYNIQKNAIDLAIGPDIEAIDKIIEEKEEQKHTQKTPVDLKTISEEIKNLKLYKNNLGIIQNARVKKHNMNIEIIKLKKCLLANDESHNNEIEEFERNGAIGSFQISEIRPIDWPSTIGALLLGLGQLVAGVALTVFALGAGINLGTDLVITGLSDIVTAVKDGIINRDFSWARWAIDKAIGLTVAVACAGWKAMKDVATIAYSGIKNAGPIGKNILTETVKEGWKIVGKRAALKLAKESAKQIVSGLTDYEVSKTIIPLIRQAIIEKIRGPIEEALQNNPSIKMMLELDQIRDNQYYENRIITMGMKLLKPENSKNIFDLADIAKKIATRIADKKIRGFSAALQVTNVIEAVAEISILIEKFINKLNEAIDKEAKEHKLAEQLKNRQKITNQQETKESQKVIEKIEGDIDLNLLHVKDEQAKLQKTQKNVKGMSESFVNVISTTMVNSIQQKIIRPLDQASANYSIESVTSNVTRSLDEYVETYRSYRRIIQHQAKGFNNARTEEERNTAENNQRINKVERLINDVRSGGPSGLVHLGAASDAIDRPIEVYNEDGKLKYVIGDTKKKIPAKIQYHEPKMGEKIGHYTLLGSKEPIKDSADQNMCLYNGLAAQTGHDPNKLKNATLRIMENNKSYIARQIDDINRLEIYSQLRLAIGGATYNGKYPDDAEKILRDSTGTKAFNVNNPGHPLHHAPFRGTTDQKLEAISQQLRKRIIIYDESGIVLYSKGDHFNKAPIELTYHKPPGDTSGEWFSSRGGSERPYRLHNPNDKILYKIICNQVKCDSNQLRSAVTDRINQIPIHLDTFCIENYSIRRERTGFLSQADMNYVTHHVLTLDSVKEKMNELNTLNFDQQLSRGDCRKILNIPIEDLGISRKIYGRRWKKGYPIGQIKPVHSIVIVLQHHDGEEHNPNAPVHIQTIFPRIREE